VGFVGARVGKPEVDVCGENLVGGGSRVSNDVR